ncbi:STY4526/YPO1902 family pathogenicity island replication protein [uncultured Pseudoteredinibacter sp.]|uniref:STY4526/YPO1902 family pathogenicity island replication protein n=1 Tax=uncultured Pseudoteredinibacter sp. TaxID=1641701 RepID=UPI0026174F97|nr:STY4526/YPO1902 family pathogenicity island replication protein [uncultured Pseudoteredinibacter sp.]
MLSINKILCSSVAKKFLAHIEVNPHTSENCFHLDDDLIFMLSNLTLGQQRFLIERAHNFIDISLKINVLKSKINELKDHSTTREIEDTYLLHGAPLCLMKRLFGIHATEFSRRRKLLNLAGSGSGRPRLTDENTEHTVWKHWQSFSNLRERERFIRTAEKTGLDLHVVWTSLKDHID